jgi:hypothetical protein
VTEDLEAYQIELFPLRFTFVAREPLHFPIGKSTNLLRGAFGTVFRQITCDDDCPGARHCLVRANCSYARMFEPSALNNGPSGLRDWPRPFVFRASHLDGKTIAPESSFFFDLYLFDTRHAAVAALEATFNQLAGNGLGANRARVELIGVRRLDENHCPHQLSASPAPMVISLNRSEQHVSKVRVQFVTPTELKVDASLAKQPDFDILAARIRDRISTLRELYGNGPLTMDFRSFGERAARIQMTRCDLKQIATSRRSSRTGQVHSIGGFVGEADYEGDLAEFIPFLRAAQWTGVGRQTVWGKGEIHISLL